MRESFVELNGHRTRLMQSGSAGPVLIFLHGFPEWSGAWEKVFAALPEYRCFAPDQRGYGVSYRPSEIEDYATGRLARDVFDLIGLLGFAEVHLVGHDWGASVAYAGAFARDPRVKTLTILNGVHPIPFQKALAAGGAQAAASQYIPWLRRERSEEILTADNFARLAGLFADGMDMGWLDGTRLDTYRRAWSDTETVRAMVNWYRASPIVVPAPGETADPATLPDFPEDRMRVTVPHLLIWGMGDTALLPEARAGLDALADDLTVHEIPDADHWLHHQKPGEVAALIRDFMTRNT